MQRVLIGQQLYDALGIRYWQAARVARLLELQRSGRYYLLPADQVEESRRRLAAAGVVRTEQPQAVADAAG